MKPTTIRYAAMLLGFAVLVELVFYRKSTDALLVGLPYLMAANLACLVCVGLVSRWQMGIRKENVLEPPPTVLQIRTCAFLLVACQLAVVGTLNISTVVSQGSPSDLLLDYAAMVFFFFASYRVVSVTDDARQTGGYIPFNFIGRPRSRRFLFALFAGYCAICPLSIMSLEVSIIRGEWYPEVLRAPQACLLMAALMATMSWGLLSHRYGAASTERHKHYRVFAGGAALFILCTGAIQRMLSLGSYVYILSVIAIAGCTAVLYYLWFVEGPARSNNEMRTASTAVRT